MSFHRLETLILFYVFQFLLSGNLLPFLYLQLPFLSPLRYLLTFNEVKVFLPLICILLLYVEHRDIAFKRKTKSNSLFKRYWVGARGSPPYRLTPPWLLLVQHVRSTFISITSEPAKRRLFPYFVSNEAIWSPQHFLIKTNSKIVCIWHLEIKIKTIKCVIFLSYVNTNRLRRHVNSSSSSFFSFWKVPIMLWNLLSVSLFDAFSNPMISDIVRIQSSFLTFELNDSNNKSCYSSVLFGLALLTTFLYFNFLFAFTITTVQLTLNENSSKMDLKELEHCHTPSF